MIDPSMISPKLISHDIASSESQNRSAHFRGRSLLSIADYDDASAVVVDADNYSGYIRNVTLPPANISVDCSGGRYVNQTESILYVMLMDFSNQF